MKILIAEDDPVTLDSIEMCLSDEGFATVTATDGSAAVESWKTESPDLVCLDIMMPGIDGYEVCRTIRNTDKHLPILFLSAKNEEIDVVVGLEIGADDFIRKPFGKHELIARIRSALRRVELTGSDHHSSSITIGGRLELFPRQLRAVDHSRDIEINLSPREISILQLLHKCRGDAVHRDQILDQCWGLDYYPESRTLDQHIVNLRKKIEPDPANPTLVETVRGVGYRIRQQP